MLINLKNCNSIEEGTVELIENSLNMKYAINGTGKSTISRAIEYKIQDLKNTKNQLSSLKPFKYRSNTETNNPEVNGIDDIDSIAIFNEDYVNQYVFQPNELLKNSFDIFINNDEYKQGMQEINELIKEISKTFEENEDIEVMLEDLNNLHKSFGTARGLAKSSSLYKAFGNGNPVENIPEGLEVYQDFIKHTDNTKWFKWQMGGKNYLDISTCCPYCTSTDIETKKETILAVEDKYDSKLIEHLNKVLESVSRLSSYFIPDSYEKIIAISKSIDGLQEEHENFLLQVRNDIYLLIQKLLKVKQLGFQSLKDFDRVDETIRDLKIDLQYITNLNTENTSEKINMINNSLDQILEQSGQLQGKVNLQKIRVQEIIAEYNEEINNFLQYAGYNYSVDIIEEDTGDASYKIQLRHNEFVESNIDDARNHLSFGEKNAFALILFMFEVLKNNPKLVILDDPISSFDKNKKFAIMEKLFRGEKSLRDKTVLLLTHDFEPIVDIIYHHPDIFNNVQAKATYLENIDGQLIEKQIEASNIKTFIEIAIDNIATLDEELNKLIYLRRFYEVTDNKGLEYQLLSNLFHKREIPTYKETSGEREMTEEEIRSATEGINSYIDSFNYQNSITNVLDNSYLIELYSRTDNNYEKLQIYRVLFNENHENRVIRKFINETFHIENDYIYQLNPCEYQTIPHYIIQECNKDIETTNAE